MTTTVRPRFVVFEGGEACGKSTQAEMLAAQLGAVLTREPGGTPMGERVRAVLLDPGTGALDPRAEALLIAADRAQHVATVVAPALSSGRHVVSDRFSGSSVAYQGYGRGLDLDWLRRLSRDATGGVAPDLVVFLDVPAAVARRRVAGTRLDRFEREDPAFHERVLEGFRAQAAAEPAVWVRLDGSAPVAEVAAAVRGVLRDRLQLPL